MLTWLNEEPKVEEFEITRIKSKFLFLQGLKPEFANIIGTKSGVNPFIFKGNAFDHKIWLFAIISLS